MDTKDTIALEGKAEKGYLPLGWRCPHCDKILAPNVRKCPCGSIIVRWFVKDGPPSGVINLSGWTCPVCGRGLAPHVSECSCLPEGCTLEAVDIPKTPDKEFFDMFISTPEADDDSNI